MVSSFLQVNKSGVKFNQVAQEELFRTDIAECRGRVFFIHILWVSGAWYFIYMVRAFFMWETTFLRDQEENVRKKL